MKMTEIVKFEATFEEHGIQAKVQFDDMPQEFTFTCFLEPNHGTFGLSVEGNLYAFRMGKWAECFVDHKPEEVADARLIRMLNLVMYKATPYVETANANKNGAAQLM
jgi:hypothetical protein